MQSTLKTRATRANDPPITSAVMSTPAIRAQSQVGPACKSVIPDPTARRSAVTFNVLATINAVTRTDRTIRPRRANFCAASSPRLRPVASAVRSHISWTAAISGNVIKAGHNRP
jgi:hypothetical protein